jgi:hypothetical protein
MRLTTVSPKTLYVKKPYNGCWMREEWASVINEAKILR